MCLKHSTSTELMQKRSTPVHYTTKWHLFCITSSTINYFQHAVRISVKQAIEGPTPRHLDSRGRYWTTLGEKPAICATSRWHTVPRYSTIVSNFLNSPTNHYLLSITFISDRCCCSWAVVTPAKYEVDWTDLPVTNTFSNKWCFRRYSEYQPMRLADHLLVYIFICEKLMELEACSIDEAERPNQSLQWSSLAPTTHIQTAYTQGHWGTKLTKNDELNNNS